MGANMDNAVYLPLLIIVPKTFENIKFLILRHCFKVRDKKDQKKLKYYNSIDYLPFLIILLVGIYINIEASWTI
jgi:hypothetical protein